MILHDFAIRFKWGLQIIMAPRGGNDPLGSIPLFYAVSLEDSCGDTGLKRAGLPFYPACLAVSPNSISGRTRARLKLLFTSSNTEHDAIAGKVCPNVMWDVPSQTSLL